RFVSTRWSFAGVVFTIPPKEQQPPMPRKLTPVPDWVSQACELRAKYDHSLRQGAADLGKTYRRMKPRPSKTRSLSKTLVQGPRPTRLCKSWKRGSERSGSR